MCKQHCEFSTVLYAMLRYVLPEKFIIICLLHGRVQNFVLVCNYKNKAMLFAHRGIYNDTHDPVDFPTENSQPAIQQALDNPGFNGVEVDVRFTLDDVPVIMHDAAWARTCAARPKMSVRPLVKDLTHQELDAYVRMKSADDDRVPRLFDVCRLAKHHRKTLILDFKPISPRLLDRLLTLLTEWGMLSTIYFIITWFNPPRAMTDGAGVAVFRGLNTAKPSLSVMGRMKRQFGFDGLSIRYDPSTSVQTLADTRKAGLRLNVYVPEAFTYDNTDKMQSITV